MPGTHSAGEQTAAPTPARGGAKQPGMTGQVKEQIITDQQAKMKYLFEQLGVTGNKATVEKYVSAPERHKPLPAALKA